MRWIAAILFAVVAFPTHSSLAASAPDLQSALPPHARLLSRVGVAGSTNVQAVTYAAPDNRVGLVARQSGVYRLIWSRSLQYPARLFELPEPGVFAGTAELGPGKPGAFFAYRYLGTDVMSAIQSHPHGIVEADEGARYRSTDFVVIRSDSAHVGSVKYRIVTRYGWSGSDFAAIGRERQPDYGAGELPAPRAAVTTAAGNTVLLRLAIAATEQQQETGLMNIKYLDPDSGMIFVWDEPVLDSFWMENTYIPLTVAFLSPNGTIQEMQDMQPLTITYHTPLLPFQYAIEANLGFFARNGIQDGDRFNLDLTGASGSGSHSLP